ncbi:hypothetical protein [Flavobacterium gyeonganense]|uniref:Uncharacterized protein n=1 Tax=Flavobacterium gyeonganense TaxID=1310418 RepID=A0ABV5H9D6_9FLAO|nr:hypothetical protein [Flavobacterium gyeonganense]
MRKALLLCLLLASNFIYSQDEAWEKFAKKNKDVLGLNAIVADKSYYSQAILEFLIVKQIIEKAGENVFDIPNSDPQSKRLANIAIPAEKEKIINLKGKHIIRLFDSKPSQNKTLSNAITDSLGVAPCEIVVPKTIQDLKSGFQFRHYLFKGDNKTALQAFGIINNEIKTSDLYVVIDYLQFQDCNCTGLPKIRYAVGVRSEFKISGIELNKGNEENSLSIEKLAARVEFGQIKVDISMKTIGITGKSARLNIPVNTSFDVQTYGEYTKVIDFIRNSIDEQDITKVMTQPELIPVMDEYRTSVSDINTAVFKELKIIQKKYIKELSDTSSDYIDPMASSIEKIIKESLIEEIDHKNNKRKTLYGIDKKVNDLNRYLAILQYTYSPSNFEQQVNTKLREENKLDLGGGTVSSIQELYSDGFKLLENKKFPEALAKFREVYKVKPTYGNADEIIDFIEQKINGSITEDQLFETIIKNNLWLAPGGTEEKLNKARSGK